MIDVQITQAQDLQITIEPIDDAGSPAKVQLDSATAISDNRSVLENGEIIEQTEEKVVILCKSSKFGQAIITVSADADLGEGVETISDTVNAVVNSLRATNLGLSAVGVPKTTPPPVE